MLDRLRALDDRFLPGDEAAQARSGSVALTILAAVGLVASVDALHDGQTPGDWRILLPTLLIGFLVLRAAHSGDLPGGALLAKAATGSAVFLALLVGGVSEGLAAMLCLVGVGLWAARATPNPDA